MTLHTHTHAPSYDSTRRGNAEEQARGYIAKVTAMRPYRPTDQVNDAGRYTLDGGVLTILNSWSCEYESAADLPDSARAMGVDNLPAFMWPRYTTMRIEYAGTIQTITMKKLHDLLCKGGMIITAPRLWV